MSTYEQYLAIGVVIPLASFVLLAFFGARIGKPAAGWIATLAIGLSAVLAGMVFFGWMGLGDAERTRLTNAAARFHWADLGSIPITVGVKLDSLTVAMYFMVTFISTCIHLFSIGYMAGHSDEVDHQSKYHRFFAYLSLFCFSMLGLVVSSSLLFLFIFWELVGLCSYLLIGFYFDRKYASNAAMKAFITNRVGDFGFLAGMMLVVLYLGTFDLDQAAVTFETAAHQAGAAPMPQSSRFASGWATQHADLMPAVQANAAIGAGLFRSKYTLFGMGLATLMGVGLFCGAMGKSAQVPLQVWLPDAMAGPTPVSALIHAATMVAAGVYLVARIFRLLTPEAQLFIAVIGCLTLTVAALIAIVQTDIKKVLAYSTLSQLGYMIFGMGVGAWTAALFHLITHAFFKALMFLGSGQVIEGCHHEQDIRKMGGLRSKMPVTCWTFLIGVLAIAGFGIPATYTGMSLGLGGYFSKDEILAVAYDRAFGWPGAESEDVHAAFSPPYKGGAGGGRFAQQSHRTTTGLVAGVAFQDERGAQSGAHGVGRPPLTPPLQGGEEEGAGVHAAGGRHDVHAASARRSILHGIRPLPAILFTLALIIAYVTPFYMMRCWWLTFMGKPRDHHVHEHAHESPLMYLPLVVLAVGTFVSSYLWFRPMLASAAPVSTDAAMVVGLDGIAESSKEAAGELINVHAAHHWLADHVGWSWAVGFFIAWLIYRGGIGLAGKLAKLPLVSAAHFALERKLFFDDIYDNVLVRGTVLLASICKGLFDALIDGIVNLAAAVTRRFAEFTGRQVDMAVRTGDVGLVDAMVNGVAAATWNIGDGLRKPQSGRIRVYLMVAAASAAVVLIAVIWGPGWADTVSRWYNATRVTAMR